MPSLHVQGDQDTKAKESRSCIVTLVAIITAAFKQGRAKSLDPKNKRIDSEAQSHPKSEVNRELHAMFLN